jgi:hypothetical protein
MKNRQELQKELKKAKKAVNMYGTSGLIVFDSVLNERYLNEKSFYSFQYFTTSQLQDILNGKIPCFKELEESTEF